MPETNLLLILRLPYLGADWKWTGLSSNPARQAAAPYLSESITHWPPKKNSNFVFHHFLKGLNS